MIRAEMAKKWARSSQLTFAARLLEAYAPLARDSRAGERSSSALPRRAESAARVRHVLRHSTPFNNCVSSPDGPPVIVGKSTKPFGRGALVQ
jgi:hypothetical protein